MLKKLLLIMFGFIAGSTLYAFLVERFYVPSIKANHQAQLDDMHSQAFHAGWNNALNSPTMVLDRYKALFENQTN